MMKIGVLTFLHVSNFGANLQAFSTYMYLKNHGHEPVYLDYSSGITEFYKKMTLWKRHLLDQSLNPQDKEHLHFVDKMIDGTANEPVAILDLLHCKALVGIADADISAAVIDVLVDLQ